MTDVMKIYHAAQEVIFVLEEILINGAVSRR